MMHDSFMEPSFGRSFEFGFTVIPILAMIIFIIVIVVFVVVFAKGIRQWNKNNHSPRLTVDATVVAKRTDIHHSSKEPRVRGFSRSELRAEDLFFSESRKDAPISQ